MNTRLLDNIEDVVVRCCGDESTSFAWNSLKELDLSNNSISRLGDSLVSQSYMYIHIWFEERKLSYRYWGGGDTLQSLGGPSIDLYT